MSTIVCSVKSFLLVIVLLVTAHMAAPTAAGAVAGQPISDAIQFPTSLRPDVEEMLRSSATFRSQSQRIAEATLTLIGVRVDPTLTEGNFRARSTFRLYDSGLIVVAVSIAPGSHQAEWIAHEFEHIVEQLEGWDLPGLAVRRAKGVWYSGCDVFETSRAVGAGRAVREELQRRNSRSDKLVE